ncbi:mitochondrial import receptor subunit TOM40 homolog 1-like [Centruroides sculpturatus]|uniref:mitochondrial import receptor subunit TOM40 homolog 1-like n=1 Tax=Centruroides sculpturatus TaxID=218467 RepID=UPI000C6E9F66|nr:mitochondrial import receptor subunit TOM40 homolog 1-like [Centruroides sculpturatus]
MGNIFAASSPSSPLTVGSSGIQPIPSLHKEKNGDDDNGLSNPGTMEELHQKCKDIFPVNFEGAKLIVNKGLSNHFQISHTLNMSSITPSGYRFGATYVGSKQFSPTEAYPVLLGDIDPNGNLNANIIHQINRNVRTKFAAQIQDSKYVVSQLTTDYKGSDFTTSATLGNIDIQNKSGVIVLHYLQAITKAVSLGAEMVYQYGPQVPGNEISLLSLAGRYTGSNYVWSSTISANSAHACYYHKGSENLQVGVEVETDFRLGDSVATIGYMLDLPKADLVFRGMVDSNGTVGGVLEKKLQPLPFTFTLSGMISHSKKQSRFGCGLIIG